MDFTFQKASFSASKCEAFQVDTPPKTNMEPENTHQKKGKGETSIPNHPILGFQILGFQVYRFIFFRRNTATASNGHATTILSGTSRPRPLVPTPPCYFDPLAGPGRDGRDEPMNP